MRIIGSFLSVLLIVSGILNAQCDVYLKIQNSMGDEVASVSVGVPFQLHVVVDGDCKVEKINLGDLNNFNPTSLGTMQSIRSINGVVDKTVTYRYNLRIDDVGKYVLGPIDLICDGKKMQTQKIDFEVVEPSGDKVEKYPSAVLKIDKEKVFLGEQFLINIRLYFKKEQLSSINIDLPKDFKSKFEIELLGDPGRGSEIQDGAEVKYLDWQILAAAKESGDFIIPAIQLLFEKVTRQDLFSFFNSYEQGSLFTNSSKLQVIDLPDSDNLPQGIGVFDSFTAGVDRDQVSDSHGATLKLVLKGSGNWSKIKFSDLDMPSGLQVYESKNYLSGDIKTFEFVLQGIEVGKHTIPKQSFYYFDTDEKKYKTLETDQIEINVLSVSKDDPYEEKSGFFVDEDKNSQIKIKPLSEKFSGKRQIILRKTPFWLFLILAIFPFLFFILVFVLRVIAIKRDQGFRVWYKKLHTLKQKDDIAGLYSFFTHLLRIKFEANNALEVSGLDEGEKQELALFLHSLSQISFGGITVESGGMFDQALNWLLLLEGVYNEK